MPPNTTLVSLPKPTFPVLRAARHAKEERLNTWLFNRRLSGEWTARFDFGYPLFGHRIERKFIKRLPKRTWRQFSDWGLGTIGDFVCSCLACTLLLSKMSMPDPNRDQRNLREETTDLWLRKRRAQQLILRKDHHLFEFYFILYRSGRWSNE